MLEVGTRPRFACLSCISHTPRLGKAKAFVQSPTLLLQSLIPGSFPPFLPLPPCSWPLTMTAEPGPRNWVTSHSTTHCVTSAYLCFLICKIRTLLKLGGISMRVKIKYGAHLARLSVIIVLSLVILTIYCIPALSL